MIQKSKLLHLGAAQSGKRLYLDPEVRKTHMHVLGASGRGKSYFLEYLIRQDIRNGDGLCLIDPHGTLYRKVVAWCAEYSSLVPWDKLILLDASAAGWAFGFNPLHFAGANNSYCVDSMVNACAQVWGGENTAYTPLLKRVLRGVFHALVDKNLSLLEARYLINEREEFADIRRRMTGDIGDAILREEWARWNTLKPHEFREQFASTTNRLDEFITATVIRRIIGQTDSIINFRRVMDEGGVVLVNLEGRGQISEFNARTLGTLLTNDIFLKANDRLEGSRPFYLYIDECGKYLNESIQRILDESRKRGLHLILSHQHLSQLKEAGETVYSAVMTDAQTKVIFGGIRDEDGMQMVKEVFLDLNLEEPKESLTRRVAVGQERIIMRSGGSSSSQATGSSSTRGTTTNRIASFSNGKSQSESRLMSADGVYDQEAPVTMAWGMTQGESYGDSDGLSESEAQSISEVIAENNGWTEAFQTIYADAVGGHFSLEEQRYKKAAWLRRQPKQMALLALPDFSLTPFRVADVRPARVTEKATDTFIENRFRELPYVSPEQEVLEHIAARGLSLKNPAGDSLEKAEHEFDPWS